MDAEGTVQMELFTKVVDDEGKESYEAYESNTTDVDDVVFYKDERYKTVSDRDAQRRIRHKKVVDQVEEHGFVVDDEGNVAAKEEEKEEEIPEDVAGLKQFIEQRMPSEDTLFERFKGRLQKEATETAEAQVVLNTRVDSLMKDNGLEGDLFKNVLLTSTNPEETAKALGQANLRFDKTNDGDDSGSDDGTSALVSDFRKKMRLDED